MGVFHIVKVIWEEEFQLGFMAYWSSHVFSGCPGNFEVITGDGPLPMAIFELLEYIVNEVNMAPTVLQVESPTFSEAAS